MYDSNVNKIVYDATKIFQERDENGELFFSYPYTKKCGKCKQETMEGDVCSNCGYSYHQEQCPRCGNWMHHDWIDKELGYCTYKCKPEIDAEKKREEARKEMKRALPTIEKFSDDGFTISLLGNEEMYFNRKQLEALKNLLNNYDMNQKEE